MTKTYRIAVVSLVQDGKTIAQIVIAMIQHPLRLVGRKRDEMDAAIERAMRRISERSRGGWYTIQTDEHVRDY